ncbi:Hint domain-containing protein [Flavobacterium sp. TR2]|uniref:Hint domain-containing protein n=1 Tax=Flavobacterium sp. TR2 TaxID=2977321 RepID=UPI0021B0E4E2|nr:Hint domain-containing protein [Flavobacterium sp. TR2]UWY26358.1 Hint domain-containing protein [Flavobacterium sp. TR2]
MESGSDKLLKDLSLKCTAGDTKIATSSGERSILDFEIGDSVLAFSVKLESNRLELSSSEAKVTFSSGTTEKAQELYVLLENSREIVCTREQPFLLKNGKYARGSELRPGQELVDGQGNAVRIKTISLRKYSGIIYNISVGDYKFTSPNGHLLLAQGVIIGDFAFQVSFDFLPNSLKE